jgi:hypothetical protein
MRIDVVQTIKDRLTMREVLERYGYEPNRAGFVCCPFHNEKTPSMKVFDKDYHCFGCGENGDIITFVQRLFDLSFQDALNKIDVDFCLGLHNKPSLAEYRKSQKWAQERKVAQEKEKAEKARIDLAYWTAFDRWLILEKNKKMFAPICPNENLHPKFVDALKNLEYAKWLLDEAEARRWQWENERKSNKVNASDRYVIRG